MKILHVVHAYPPSMGGSQWLVKNLSEQLVSQFGDEVTVLTTNAIDTATFSGQNGQLTKLGETMENGVRVRRFPMRRGYLPRKLVSGIADKLHLPGWDTLRAIHQGPIMPRLTDAVATSGADVVMAMAFPLWHMFAAQKGAEQANIPMVFLGALHPADNWGYNRPMIFNAIQRANAYIALSPFERDFLVSQGIDANKITLTGGGVDLPQEIQSTTLARQQLELSSASVILAMGRQNQRKQFSLLLEAMPHVWQDFPNAQVIFAGAAAESTPELKQFKDARVQIWNNISEAEKHTLLDACDVLILPSTEESFGIVFIEAWSHSKPVIGANVGAISSLITHRQNGLLFKHKNADSLAKAIGILLADSSLCQKMGRAGQQKVLKNYTWDAVTKQVRQAYQNVIA